jgi:nitrite reductase/ring-hydroxylating ferredoxin subunit
MGKIKVLNINDLENNQSKVVNVDDKAIAVFNVDGEFFAIDDKC